MLTIPQPMLNALNLSTSSKVYLSIKAGKFTIDPAPTRRHSLGQLLSEWKPVVGRLRRTVTGPQVGPSVVSLFDGARRHLSCLACPATGREQQGKRPVLVLSRSEFNRVTGLPIVAPITTGGRFARTMGFAVSLNEAGARTTGIVRCDQPCVLNLQASGKNWKKYSNIL